MTRMFGTDGIRGVANIAPMSPEVALQLGRASVPVLAPASVGRKPVFVIGRDTRLSGPMLEGALVAGLCSAGADVRTVGVLPTPGVAYLTRQLGAVAGVMISASHNPYADNGIKFFSAEGYKLDDQLEEAIESEFHASSSQARVTGADVGGVWDETHARQDYIDFLAATFAHACSTDLRIGLDCAHGAASEVAPRLFQQLGAQVAVWHASPDGRNINAQCGSLYPEFLQRKVVEEGLDLGFAFDGDADRVMAVDHTGRCLDGDYILTVAAQALQRQGNLAQNVVVSTVMANMGLDKALQAMGVTLYKTQVGDKYVMQEMQNRGAVLGGEQSGHILFLQQHTTGDGLLAALQLVQAVVAQKTPLAELAQVFHKFPQKLVNVCLRERHDPLTVPHVQDAIQDAEATLGQEGRILVRLSGTEPVARVMVEGPSHTIIDPLAQQIAHAITAELGRRERDE